MGAGCMHMEEVLLELILQGAIQPEAVLPWLKPASKQYGIPEPALSELRKQSVASEGAIQVEPAVFTKVVLQRTRYVTL